MKIKLVIPFLLLFSALMLLGFHSSSENSSHNPMENAIVLIKFKAQPEKGQEAAAELVKLLKEVKKEPHFVSIRMHIDPNDDTNILLYEEWEDVSYYNSAHMETDHIQAFMANSTNFLAGPPDITFWNVEQVFTGE